MFFNEFNTNFFSNKTNYIDQVNIFFIKTELTYTKLKYSRVPQGDIVSGGAAAFFSAFIGYLITEKFGVELVDSGDFYFLVMYTVFFLVACRFWLKSLYNTNPLFIFKPITNMLQILKSLLYLFKG